MYCRVATSVHSHVVLDTCAIKVPCMSLEEVERIIQQQVAQVEVTRGTSVPLNSKYLQFCAKH